MFRIDNPTNNLLNESLCYFKVRDSALKVGYQDDPIYHSLVKNSGELHLINDSELKLTIPHSKSDAFGGVFAINKLTQNSNCTDMPDTYQEEGLIPYLNSTFQYKSWLKHIPTLNMPGGNHKTFLQLFLGKLLKLADVLKFDRIALPICLDNLSELNSEHIWGNSLIIITFRIEELSKLVEVDKGIWKETLRVKALRVSELLKTRQNLTPLKNTLLISSLGSLDAYPWANQIDPRKITMIPTPMSDDSVNLVLWSSRTAQILSICAAKGHWLLEQKENIQDVWLGVIHGA